MKNESKKTGPVIAKSRQRGCDKDNKCDDYSLARAVVAVHLQSVRLGGSEASPSNDAGHTSCLTVCQARFIIVASSSIASAAVRADPEQRGSEK